MNSIAELKKLIEEGKCLYKEKTIENKTINGRIPTTECNVPKEKLDRWLKNVTDYLDKLNLKYFKYEEGFTLKGNCIFLDEQLQKIESLLKLCSVVDADPPFKISKDNIMLYIFKILEKKDLKVFEPLILVTGIAHFTEVWKEISLLELTNINIITSGNIYCLNITINTKGNEDYLSLKGLSVYQKITAPLYKKLAYFIKDFFLEVGSDVRQRIVSFFAGMLFSFILSNIFNIKILIDQITK